MSEFDEFEKQSGKDTPSSPFNRQNRFSAFSHLLIGVGLFVIIVMLCSVLGILVSGVSFEEITSGADILDVLMADAEKFKLFNFISSSLPMILTAVLVTILIRANTAKYLLLNTPNKWVYFTLAIVFVIATVPLMGPLFELNSLIDFDIFREGLQGWLSEQDTQNNKAYEAMSKGDGIGSLLTMILFMALMPAIAEEFFFRGFLMNVAHGIFKNMHVAILFSALIFTAVHMQFMKAIPMMLLAVAFGYAVYWTNSVWTAVAAHFLNNAFAVIQLRYATDGNYEELLNQEQNIPMLAVIFSLLLAVALFIYLHKNAKPKAINFYE